MNASNPSPWFTRVPVAALLVLSCQSHPEETPQATPLASSQAASASARVARTPRRGPSSAEFRRLIDSLSEPDRGFISENYVSNETSYLEVVPLLEERASGGVFIGVGPEQNFSYLAAARPELAFIVDIRRGNLLLHLLYKAMFEVAPNRSEFLCLLLSRRCGQAALGSEASIEAVISRVRSSPVSDAGFERTHSRLVEHLTDAHGFEFSRADLTWLRRAHREFHRQQFAMAFELKKGSSREYPTLGELLVQRDPRGNPAGFLANERKYRFVRKLQQDNRVIPVVGDFAGGHALAAVAHEMRRVKLTLGAFYVSNVEQYLLGDPKTWRRWMSNLSGLPGDSESLVIRAYLDQGTPHPKQRAGHRTATVAQHWSFVTQEQRESSRGTLLELSRVSLVGDWEPHDAPVP